MKKTWNDHGMMSLLDAMLFFVIMIIISGLFLTIGVTMSDSAELIRDQQSAEYNDNVRLAWMSASIPEVSYTSIDPIWHLSTSHVYNNLSVQFLIMEELRLIGDEDMDPDKFTSFNKAIQEQANLIVEPIYKWAFWAEYGDVRISMNKTVVDMTPSFEDFKKELGDEVHATTWNSLAFGEDGDVKMHFYTW